MAIGAVIVAIVVAYFGGRRGVRKETERRIEHELQADKSRRLESGREAVGHGRDSGDTPDRRVRENDGKW